MAPSDESGVGKFRKKPVVIEAVQLTPDNIEEVGDWVMDHVLATVQPDADVSATVTGLDAHLDINTLEGTMRADINDWVIRGVKGEFYPCKSDIFDATYEPETPSNQGSPDTGGE